LGVWESCEKASAILTGIRIVDDTGGLLRAPEVLFTAAEVGLDAFGYNVPNEALVAALRARLAGSERLELLAKGVAGIETGGPEARLALAGGGVLEAALIAGADGRNSLSRTAAGIPAKTWSYPQSALVTTFSHSRPHGGISTELHRPAGPLTTVPMPGLRSSLVWVEEPREAERLAALDEPAFLAELERRLQGLLGTLSEPVPRAVFPLSGLSAETAGRNRVALVGEASHVIPPIGAQGLNLGLRDAAALADCVADALSAGRDIGGPETLAAYARARAADVAARISGVDLLNRTLIADILPTHLARGLGLHLLSAIGSLRRLVVREGLQPSYAMPSLMREGGSALLEQRRGAKSAVGQRATGSGQQE
jgi:2-octaprenyl-6-methoxyphenol hydroxylase